MPSLYSLAVLLVMEERVLYNLYAGRCDMFFICCNGSARHVMNIPNAGQPVSSQSKNTHQQDQYGRPILDVVIQFTGNPTQTEKPDHFQWAEQTADPLKQEREKGRRQERNNS